MREILAKTRIILASASPRRKEILQNIGLNIEIVPSLVEENLEKAAYAGRPEDFVIDTAELKADDVFKTVSRSAPHSSLLVIGKGVFFPDLLAKSCLHISNVYGNFLLAVFWIRQFLGLSAPNR